MNPWDRAKVAGRMYVTPEDVEAAFLDGESYVSIWQDLLQAVEANAAEDASACAHVALNGRDCKVRRVRDGAMVEV